MSEKKDYYVITSNTEKRRIRLRLGESGPEILEIPHLLSAQLESYSTFLHSKRYESKSREMIGLHATFSSIFPIKSFSGNAELEYVDYKLENPEFTPEDCRKHEKTYSVPIVVRLRLVLYNNKGARKVKCIKEQEVYLGDIPMITTEASMIVNGIDRVLVPQLHRSPGVFFGHDEGKTHASKKVLFFASIIPHRGSWIEFEFDSKDRLNVRIDRKRKIPATLFLRAIGYTDKSIMDAIYQDKKEVEYEITNNNLVLINTEDAYGELAYYPITAGKKAIVGSRYVINDEHIEKLLSAGVQKIEFPQKILIGKRLTCDIAHPDNKEKIFPKNAKITANMLEKIKKLGIRKVFAIDTSQGSKSSKVYIRNTFELEEREIEKYKKNNKRYTDSLRMVCRMIRPGETLSRKAAKEMLEDLCFYENKNYDLSPIGRNRLNYRLGKIEYGPSSGSLDRKEIIDIIKILFDVKDGRLPIDDIDHLANRRIRGPGEIVGDHLHSTLLKAEGKIKEKLNTLNEIRIMPQDLINTKLITASIRDFLSQHPLSQFMDQTNPLSELTHKRRVSSLGPGGLSRDRAKFEVRDVHPTHYGRLCPIETPEGPNIGLVTTLAIFSRVNRYGLLETPYRLVIEGKVTNKIEYVGAFEEEMYYIAQSNVRIDKEGNILDDFVSCRHGQEFMFARKKDITHMDISARQITSIATALIPFLEHDDANRALMGANMQKQAVPLMRPEKPLVGTGMERIVVLDSGAGIYAKRSGIVSSVSSGRIVVYVDNPLHASDVDIYNLIKYQCSNQGTLIHQKPIVNVGDPVLVDDLIADDAATDLGEIALGKNVLVAFMSWSGYNFEDSVVVSEKLIKEETLTSIHIQELTCIASETKLGDESITLEVPNVSESALSLLDNSGIVYIGAEVKENDIIVGKVTPKPDQQLIPEERLLYSIFSQKPPSVKDSSLRVPPGVYGTVIDVQLTLRSDLSKDTSFLIIEEFQRRRLELEINQERLIREGFLIENVASIILESIEQNGFAYLDDEKIHREDLPKIHRKRWFDIQLQDLDSRLYLKSAYSSYVRLHRALNLALEGEKEKLKAPINLTPGVAKEVKIILAVKRRIQPGDKVAGRHGNKGVISVIVPEEDMPHLPDGTPIDVVLNPLGIPSRMNAGQLLENYLGWVSKGLGRRVSNVLNTGSVSDIRNVLSSIYDASPAKKVDFNFMTDREIKILAKNLTCGVPVAAPVFEGPRENDIHDLLTVAGMTSKYGRIILTDGRTGEPFDMPITVGYTYLLKLNHLVDDKMHARSTGSYSLITQQPLGGRAQFGGQRFGEMEVWALEAYGAAYTLQEMLTVKSDDIVGRAQTYKNIVDGDYDMIPNTPESFNVLIRELRSLGIDVTLQYQEDEPL